MPYAEGKDCQEFAIALASEMKSQIAEGGSTIVDLDIRSTVKTNDNDAQCIAATFADGKDVSPSLYVRPMYDEWRNGEATIEDLASQGIRTLEIGHEHAASMNLRDGLLNPEDARNHLYLQLINGEANPEIKEKCPHIELNDLVAVARWKCFQDSENGTGSILITHDIQTKMLHMTDEEILKLARDNTLSQEYTVKGMTETLMELMGDGMPEEMKEALRQNSDGPEQMYVMTNAEKVNGATALLSTDTLEMAHDKIGEDYFIIPSSLHEVILIPESKIDNPSQLRDMCREVNATQVSVSDRLGENIYFCDGKHLSICNSMEQLHDIRESFSESAAESISESISRRM